MLGICFICKRLRSQDAIRKQNCPTLALRLSLKTQHEHQGHPLHQGILVHCTIEKSIVAKRGPCQRRSSWSSIPQLHPSRERIICASDLRKKWVSTSAKGNYMLRTVRQGDLVCTFIPQACSEGVRVSQSPHGLQEKQFMLF